jgi:hypothetical protein
MAKATPETVTPTSEILAATLVDDGLALVLGWSDRLLPETAATGSLRLHQWRRQDDSHWFLAVLEGEDAVRAAAEPLTLVSPNRRLRFVLPAPARLSLDAAGLLERLVVEGAEVARLLSFLESALAGGGRRAALLFACLHRFSEADGYIEILGRTDAATVLLQGWSARLGAGTAELVLETDEFRPATAAVATYERPDLGAAARGILAVLPATGLDLRTVRRAFFRRGDGWRRLEMFENRRFLAEAETTPFLGGLYPSLHIERANAPLFKRLGRRFEGHETVSGLAQPVRAALDLAVAASGTGLFLTGWLLDPESRVAAVFLRNDHGYCQRLDETWHRSARRDVSDGYGRDPLFAGRLRPGDDGHGFVVGVPCQPDTGSTWYLELALTNDECAFLPVPLTEPSTAVVQRMLTSIDIAAPAAESLIARHLGPVASAASAQAAEPRRAQLACSFGQPPRRPRITAVVPMLRPAGDFHINLARFAVDAEMAAVELLVVTRAAWASSMGAGLQRQARFYGRSGRLLVSPDEMDAFQALELGAEAAASDLLLLLSPSVFPKRPGWVSRMVQALTASDKVGAVCPTLVYEDESLKFAGRQDGLGYARHWLSDAGAAPQAVPTGTPDCCLIRRQTFRDLGGFGRGFVGADRKGADFFNRMSEAALQCLWLPQVEMIAVDEPAETEAAPYWMQTGKLVDDWSFARKWGKRAA